MLIIFDKKIPGFAWYFDGQKITGYGRYGYPADVSGTLKGTKQWFLESCRYDAGFYTGFVIRKTSNPEL